MKQPKPFTDPIAAMKRDADYKAPSPPDGVTSGKAGRAFIQQWREKAIACFAAWRYRS